MQVQAVRANSVGKKWERVREEEEVWGNESYLYTQAVAMVSKEVLSTMVPVGSQANSALLWASRR